MRVGLLGGTFDPVHLAHLQLAEAALGDLNLDQVIFVPTGEPWLKAGQPLSPACIRLAMVRLAIGDRPEFSVSEIEVNRPGPTYTVDTLEQLTTELGPELELLLILGMDALEHFHRWKEPGRILELCRLAVAGRTGQQGFTLQTFLTQFPAAAQRVAFLPVLLPEISATQVRSRVARKDSLVEFVPSEVADYIRRLGLYRAGTKVNGD
ncbi:MAG: nicotinate (nicotinamide) nucleotide adenylyltransferase [SAR202 cluster bacterium Io17-Chloro-G9]|nr:MAG: nicotinate (nicotinamide) nucleotide adenylyltransferase [SAR202 cluster bacterium Io17-Chloro-G9]